MFRMSDEQLVKSYLTGDDASFEELIQRYLDQIFAFALNYTKNEALAEDIAQETFIKAWKNISSFDSDKRFKAWIFTIARNTALDQLKKKQTISFSSLNDENGENFLERTIIDSALRPDQLCEQYESDSWFKATVAKLSDKYRAVVIMRQNGYSFREIGEKLGEPLHTVKSRYRRALATLKKII